MVKVLWRNPRGSNNEWLGKAFGFPCGASGKEPVCQCRRHKRRGFDPWVGKISWRRKWQPTPVFLSAKSHGHRSLAGYIPQDCNELDVTEVTEHNRTGLSKEVLTELHLEG